MALEAQFLCRDGLCQNITRIMSCDYTEVGPQYDCTDKRNCIMLTGLFQCRAGLCTQVTMVTAKSPSKHFNQAL